MTDILDAIDDALACQHCDGPLRDSPSDLYCSQSCQEKAAARITQPVHFRDYGSTWRDREWTFADAPEGPPSWLGAPVWRLPRSTGDRNADWKRWEYARKIATEEWQREACRVRREDLDRRRGEGGPTRRGSPGVYWGIDQFYLPSGALPSVFVDGRRYRELPFTAYQFGLISVEFEGATVEEARSIAEGLVSTDRPQLREIVVERGAGRRAWQITSFDRRADGRAIYRGRLVSDSTEGQPDAA